MAASLRLMLGGDVMLGRMVGKSIDRHGFAHPLRGVAGLLREADLTLVNLECAITASGERWTGAPKAFYFGAPPAAVHTLMDAGIGMVSLANNHVLDFNIAGLDDTLACLRHHGITFAGAGGNAAQAWAPACAQRHGIRIGMVALCDHQADFAADATRSGIAYIDLEDQGAAMGLLGEALAPLLRAGVDWPILSLHWGPNMVSRPCAAFRDIAHAAIDMGWKILYGHSAHVFHGVGLYRGCPIVYAAGDLVDDYHVDPGFRNDRQLLFEIALGRDAVQRISLHPVLIERCQAKLADGADAEAIVKRMRSLCRWMGARVCSDQGKVWIELQG